MINSAVQDLLNNPDTTDRPPRAFKFNDALDAVGLPLESMDYVKKNCKKCYGRGYESRLVGNGYHHGQKLQARNLYACVCVNQGYNKARLATEAGIEIRKPGVADLLNVSVEYVNKLIDEKKLPRNLNMDAVLAYKAEDNKRKQAALKELSQLGQELQGDETY